MRTSFWATGCALSFVAGAATVLAYVTFAGSQVPTDWVDLSKKKDAVLYSTEAFLKADIALPDIKEFRGKAKFIESVTSPGSYALGYVAKVSVLSLDLKKVPKKYLIDKQVEIDGAKVIENGIKQVSYDVVFNFTLQDKDGFSLLNMSSKPHVVESGKSNDFQSVVETNVTREVAARTKHVLVNLYVDKCLTCEGK